MRGNTKCYLGSIFCVPYLHNMLPESILIALTTQYATLGYTKCKELVLTSVERVPIQIPVPFTLHQSFLEVHILTSTYQKAFILVAFHSMTLDPRFHGRGGARGQILVHLQGAVLLLSSFLEINILKTAYQENSYLVHTESQAKKGIG